MTKYVSQFAVLNEAPIYVKDSEARTLIESEENNRITDINAMQEALNAEADARAKGDLYRYVNVKEFNAIGDGLNDDYPAFKAAYDAADYGSYIIVPYGTYNLSRNPQGSKPITWLIDQGTEFTGAGAGNTATGAGGFSSTYISNPWLDTSGLYSFLDTNGRESPGGVTNAISFEMSPIKVGGGGVHNRDWRNMFYLGTNTGTGTYDSKGNVEIINEVLNITAQKGIMEELDLNTYASVPQWCCALFITGGGTVHTKCTAIDIQRDSWLTHWETGISVRQAETTFFCENAINGFIMNRYDDSTQEGNAFQLRTKNGSTELCAIGADGWIRTQGINYIGAGIQSGTVTPTGYITVKINGVDHKVPIE